MQDRLLEASFEPDLRAILTKLPAKRQTLLFSATMTKNLVALQKAVLPDAYHFQVWHLLQQLSWLICHSTRRRLFACGIYAPFLHLGFVSHSVTPRAIVVKTQKLKNSLGNV